MGNLPSTLNDAFDDYRERHTHRECRVHQRYGWRPDLPDGRDKYVAFYPTDEDEDDDNASRTDNGTGDAADVLRVDLRTHGPAVYDDGNLACSTVSAVAALVEHHELRLRPSRGYEPSRLAWYYLVRERQGTVGGDTGCSFRDAWRMLNELIPDEVMMPFDADQYRREPDWDAYERGILESKRAVYRRVPQTLDGIKWCVLQDKPVAFGMTVYASFESSVTRRTGRIVLPACARGEARDERDNEVAKGGANTDGSEADGLLGGHAMVIVGYDDTGDGCFIVRNSQGAEWGANGYGYLPYSYALDATLARDFWVLDDDEEHEESDEETDSSDEDTDHVSPLPPKAETPPAPAPVPAPVRSGITTELSPLFAQLLDRVRA
jgi:hypothetical protein